MKPLNTVNFQIGKLGITDGVIESLKLAFKNHKRIRISLLQSSRRNRQNIKDIAEEIVSKLGNHFEYRIIGFTIIVKKKSKHYK